MVDAGVSADLLVRSKSRNNRPSKLCTSLHQGLQRKNRTRVRSFHISRSPPIDLAIPNRGFERAIGPPRWVSWDNIHMPIEKNLRTLTLALENRIRIRPG